MNVPGNATLDINCNDHCLPLKQFVPFVDDWNSDEADLVKAL